MDRCGDFGGRNLDGEPCKRPVTTKGPCVFHTESPQDPEPRPTGRPTTFDPELARTILQRIAEGELLRAICREETMPPISTFLTWVMDDRDGLSERYTRARELQAYVFADQVVEVSAGRHRMSELEREHREVKEIDSHESIARDKLFSGNLKWAAKVANPATFGDKTQLEHSVAGGVIEVPEAADSAEDWQERFGGGNG